MNSNRKKSIIVGILILFAYAVLASTMVESKIVVMIAEALSGLAVIGIAVIMFPYFVGYQRKATLAYFALRFLEGVLMVVAWILFLSSSPYLLAMRDGIYVAHTYVFIIAALIFYYLFYLSKLIPRWLSVWGIVASILLLLVNLLELMNVIAPMMILYLPIISNELVLALLLIFKGFSSVETKSEEN